MRFAKAIVAFVLLIAFAHLLATFPAFPPASMSDRPFPLLWMVLKLDQPWAPTLQQVILAGVCVTGIVAALLAFALSVRPNSGPASVRLTRALLMGSFAVAWLWTIRDFPPAAPWLLEHRNVRLVVDVVAVGLFMIAPIDLLRFAAGYPRPVALDGFWAANGVHEISPLLPVVENLKSDRTDQSARERNMLRARRNLERLLRAMQSRAASAIALLLAVIATLIWHNADAKSLVGSLGLILPMVVPILPLVFAFYVTKTHARLGVADDRRAVEWIYWSVMLAAMLFGLSFVGAMAWALTGDIGGSLKGFFYTALLGPVLIALALVVALAVSVFYRGAVDPSLMVRRTALYSVLGVLLTALFIAMEGVVSSQVITRVGLPSESGAVMAGTAVALAFGPARNRVESHVVAWMERLRPVGELSASERETLTIAFCDLAGFTSLTSRDEDAALTAATCFHRTARDVAKGHGGHVVKTLGDAVLMRFKSPGDAIDAVRRLHAATAMAFSAAQLPIMPVHSGLHTGPVAVAADGDVFGATVNLAARLQAEAASDEILLSDEMRQPAPSVHVADAGMRVLRNIPSPVKVWRVLA